MADEVQDNIEKNIDIAIEAQDGAPETPTTPTEGEQEASTEQQPKDRPSGDGDRSAQPKPPKEGKETPSAPSPKDLRLQDGTVVKGGAERRFYEQREIARAQLQTRERELTSARSELARTQRGFAVYSAICAVVAWYGTRSACIGSTYYCGSSKRPPGYIEEIACRSSRTRL